MPPVSVKAATTYTAVTLLWFAGLTLAFGESYGIPIGK
jgi:hypothetical protein